MTISRVQLAKELEPGLNALFGLEYRSEKETIMKMILARLSEPSTYAGAAAMLASLGVMGFNEGQWTMLFGAAAAVSAAVAMVIREKGKSE